MVTLQKRPLRVEKKDLEESPTNEPEALALLQFSNREEGHKSSFASLPQMAMFRKEKIHQRKKELGVV